MDRQLFIHHYFPALYFAILALGHTFQLIYTVFKNKKFVAYSIFGLIFLSSLFCYYQRLPLVNGSDWSLEKCQKTQWLKGWDYDCKNFPSEYAGNNAPSNQEQRQGGYDFDNAFKPQHEAFQNLQGQQEPLLAESKLGEVVPHIVKDEL